jgi:hypothetical protein
MLNGKTLKFNRIHTLGSLHRSKDHPDSRASMYEEKKYSKRKITDLTNVLKNFKTCVSIMNTITGTFTFETYQMYGLSTFLIVDLHLGPAFEIKSELLSSVISKFPSLDKLLDFFDVSTSYFFFVYAFHTSYYPNLPLPPLHTKPITYTYLVLVYFLFSYWAA